MTFSNVNKWYGKWNELFDKWDVTPYEVNVACKENDGQLSYHASYAKGKMSRSDVIGRHCPCPALVSLLSGFSKNCIRCLSVRNYLSRFCPNFRKNAVRGLSVRPGKDETELSGLSLSLSADVWSQ